MHHLLNLVPSDLRSLSPNARFKVLAAGRIIEPLTFDLREFLVNALSV